MAKFGDTGELLKCSFCGKSQKQVKKLIAGPGVYICDECIDLCNEIIDEELAAPVALDLERGAHQRSRPLWGDLRGSDLVAAEEAFLGAMFYNLGKLLTEYYFPDEADAIRIIAKAKRAIQSVSDATTPADLLTEQRAFDAPAALQSIGGNAITKALEANVYNTWGLNGSDTTRDSSPATLLDKIYFN